MTLEQILAMHQDPRLASTQMTYEVWQDGEVTLTKAGDIFRHRNLHCHLSATGDDAIDVNLMPERLGKNGSICVLTHEDAIIIRDWITEQRTVDYNAWAFKNGLESF